MKITPASSRQLIDLGDFLIETADDSDGEISSALRAVVLEGGGRNLVSPCRLLRNLRPADFLQMRSFFG